eukprot:3151350-Amphidinium_carterae.1
MEIGQQVVVPTQAHADPFLAAENKSLRTDIWFYSHITCLSWTSKVGERLNRERTFEATLKLPVDLQLWNPQNFSEVLLPWVVTVIRAD